MATAELVRDDNIEQGSFNLDELLEVAGSEAIQAFELATDAGVAFRQIYERWVERGGFIKGKPRNSVRQIQTILGEESKVRSLETKLAGKTYLKYQDAEKLLTLFLDNWSYDEDREVYRAIKSKNLDSLVRNLLSILFQSDDQILLPLRTREPQRRQTTASVSNPDYDIARSSRETIEELFIESDALITISRVRTIVGGKSDDAARAMFGFRRLIRELYKIDTRDDQFRGLFWIVDIGGLTETDSAYRALTNLETLATQFRGLGLIEPKDIHDLWSWLNDRVVILVGSLGRGQVSACYGESQLMVPETKSEYPWFSGDRILFEALPGRWAAQPMRLADAFGHDPNELWRIPTITAHLCLDGWDLDDDYDVEIDPRKSLRYFFHAQMAEKKSISSEKDQDDWAHCIELGQPGWRWSDSLRLACRAAFGRLGRQAEKGIDPPDDWLQAIAHLRRHQFVALRLEEFLRLSSILIQNQNPEIRRRP